MKGTRAPRRRVSDPVLGVVYLAPALLLVLGVFAYPIVKLIEISTHQSLGLVSRNVGLLNFEIVLSDPSFGIAIRNTMSLLLCVPLMTVIGLFFAILLSEQPRFRRLQQFLLMVPFFTSIAVTGIAFSNILTSSGPLNTLLDAVGLGALRRDWLADPSLALLTVGAIIVWQQSSFAIVIFYARLLSVPVSLYEAALVDGAGWWQRHLNVTIPELRSSIAFYAIYGGITIIAWVFPYVFILTRGGPGEATLTADLYIYNNAFGGSQMNLAAAAALILLIGTTILAVVVGVWRSVGRRRA